MIVVQIGKNDYEIAEVISNGKRATVRSLFSGLIGEPINKEADPMDHAVRIVCEQIKIRKLPGRNIVLIPNEDIISKEFVHQKTNKANLSKFARLEAEVILREDISKYSVVCKNYSEKQNVGGEYTSILYAIKNEQIVKIKKLFSRAGYFVSRIIPLNSAYSSAVGRMVQNSQVRAKLAEGTFAAVDFSRCKTTISIFHDFVLTYQRSLNSVFSDLMALLSQTSGQESEAVLALLKCGVSDPRLPAEFVGKASRMIASSIYDALRSIRVSLGSERMEPSTILITGNLCAYPVFSENITSNILTHYLFADDLNPALSSIIGYKRSGATLSECLLLSGAALTTPHSANMLGVIANRKREVLLNRVSMGVLTLLVAGLMYVQPYLNRQAKKAVEEDKKKIEGFADIADLNTMQSYIREELARREKAKADFPAGLSKSHEKLQKTYALFASAGGVTVKNLSYSGNTGMIEVDFYADGQYSFNHVKNIFLSEEDFLLNMNMEYTAGEDGTLDCRMSFYDNDFEKPVIGDTEEKSK